MSAIAAVIEAFNAREQATLIWAALVALLALWKVEGIGSSVGELARQLFVAKLLAPFLLAAAYTAGVVWLLSAADFWHLSSLKTTIYWFFGTAVILVGKAFMEGSRPDYFKQAITQMLAVSLLIEFFVGFYVFPLWAEMIFLPVITLLVVSDVVAGSKPELAAAKRLLTPAITGIGLFLLAYALSNAAEDAGGLLTRTNAEDFVLPFILGLSLLPLLYLYALLAVYEQLFVRLGFFIHDRQTRKRTKWRIFAACGLNLRRLRRLSSDYAFDLSQAKTDEDIKNLIARFHSAAPSRMYDDLAA